MIDHTAARSALTHLSDGYAAAIVQGWGREAGEVYRPVVAALSTGVREAALAELDEAQARLAADEQSYRALFLGEPLIRVREAIETPAEAAYLDALAADMAAFLAGEPVPATPPALVVEAEAELTLF